MRTISSERKALVPYLTAGYPNPESTLDLMTAYARAGADIIELGVPFSDPVADGPTIQRSSQAALEQGMNLDRCLETLSRFRANSDIDVVIFTYLNPVLNYGARRFIDDATKAGASGVLLTDLPLGGDTQLESMIESSPLSLIRLIAPSTTPTRAEQIAKRAQGFLYYIAHMGVTGARAALPPQLDSQVRALKRVASVPVFVGFGISNAEQAASVASVADGIVVGSALIDAVDRGGIEEAQRLLESMRRALG